MELQVYLPSVSQLLCFGLDLEAEDVGSKGAEKRIEHEYILHKNFTNCVTLNSAESGRMNEWQSYACEDE